MAKTFKGSLYRFAPVSEKTNIHVASKENAYQCPNCNKILYTEKAGIFTTTSGKKYVVKPELVCPYCGKKDIKA